MFSWGETSTLTLGQQATENISILRRKKKEYLEQCLQNLIEATKQEVLYQSSVGCKEAIMGVDEEEKKFPKFVMGLEDRPKEYKFSNKDRIYLLNELENHFTNAELYPHLQCKRIIRGYGSQKYCIRITIADPDDCEHEES